jgi:ATP-dependent protease ClpP protease subunit
VPAPDPDYRENCDRAIYVASEITQDLVDRITPELNRLRLSSPDPITLYIDSQGGGISAAETIRQLATAPNPDGQCCRLITVVTGRAASAAADLLALGDYAIAYNHAQIVYHGSRTPAGTALTYEGAASLASNLQQTNEFFSVRLARHAFPRLVLRLTQFNKEFNEYRAQTQPPVAAGVQPLIKALAKKLDPENSRMLRRAQTRQKVIGELTASVGRHLRRFKDTSSMSDARFEAELLKAVLSHKVRTHATEANWNLSRGGLDEVRDDFNILHDFHFGTQKRDLARWLGSYGSLFLKDDERAEYTELVKQKPEDRKAHVDWLKPKSEPKIQPLWYLTVSVCRLLQSEDFVLSPSEAYWLGIVDEVPGTDLANLRQMVEAMKPGPPQQPDLPVSAAPK